MTDGKPEKIEEEKDQHDLYDPTLSKEHPYYGYTKAEYEKEMESHAAWEAEQDNIKDVLAEEARAMKELLIIQLEEGTIFTKNWNYAPAVQKRKFFEVDFPGFVKKLRSDVLELTLEAMGYSIGVSKNQMARIEAGNSQLTTSNMLLLFDQVEKALIRQGKEWYDLGEFEVDDLIPEIYKKLRGWVFGRHVPWTYSQDGQLLVDNAVPPLLARYPEQSISATDPDKFDRVYANYTKADRALIKKGELNPTTYEMRKYIEDAKSSVANSPKKKSKHVVIGWAVLEKAIGKIPSENVDQDLFDQYKNDLSRLELKFGRLRKNYDIAQVNIDRLNEELDRTKYRMETAEKMVAVYEHQIRHNKEMADAGNTKAILGLPTPPPEKWTIDDVPEDLQEQIYNRMHDEHLHDMAADVQMEDMKMKDYENK